jgi:phage terminase large subunit
MIRDWASGRPRPRGIYCDHDAEDRATLERHLRPLVTRAANKAVSTGIQAVSERLRSGTNGQPRLCILRDILIHPRDPELVNAKRPTCTAEEIDGYVWDTKSGLKIGEQPLKLDDHGCDAMRYAVASQDATPSRSIVGF